MSLRFLTRGMYGYIVREGLRRGIACVAFTLILAYVCGFGCKGHEQSQTDLTVPPAPKGMAYLGKNVFGYHEFKNIKDNTVMILIPAGEFTMGSNDGADNEKPVHRVYLDEYLLDKTEVTWLQYKMFCQATNRPIPKSKTFPTSNSPIADDHPVVIVTWEDAQAYCNWAGKRLPTEAEWEKGARGADGRKYPWGNAWDRAKANAEKSVGGTTPVGSYSSGASLYGILDMAGNVWEWCEDWYNEDYYMNSENHNPKGPEKGTFRVIRGGSWYNQSEFARCSERDKFYPHDCRNAIGIRGARNVH